MPRLFLFDDFVDAAFERCCDVSARFTKAPMFLHFRFLLVFVNYIIRGVSMLRVGSFAIWIHLFQVI